MFSLIEASSSSLPVLSAMAIFSISRDLGPLLLLVLTAFVWKKHFYMRGLTYRKTVVPVSRERLMKSIFYVGFLGSIDAVLRRSGQLLARLPIMAHLLPREASTSFLLRMLLLHMPWAVWALRGPLSDRGSTRDDHGWSDTVTRSRFWKAVASYFGCRIVLSEEWRQLDETQRRRWYDRHYVIAMHPHGLLPLGAILNGLTWAGGGLRGITASGAELPEPENGGKLLHQRWFRHMKLRAAVASGACGLFPGFYEMFTTLGAFECTKPFIRESSFASPNRYVCFISTHKGFVRLALEEHRDILPMWTFGDESIMPQILHRPAWLVALQSFWRSITGIQVPPAFSGFPQLVPLTLVTGVPVSLEDLWPAKLGDAVTDAAVEEGHRRYVKAQQKLFDSNKALVAGGHQNAVIEFL
ncbi:unnamed protein product [Durusdinium trenchii]|uniref:Acyltransferase n=2 Tax=Durusdinium trenchii TaxID=1381693 RepID=A0ABP0NRI7_9DINO